MSSKTMSPTATLLRNSRLFSMPAPLPRPLNDFMGHVQSNRTSDTSTIPYPIQQAITTTPSSLPRGDWGLKRALPLRSTTKSGTPLFRINAVDTREHITDFESASDLSLTLQKFQELGIPITHHPAKTKFTKSEPRTNIFDASVDNTDPQIPKTNREGKQNTRWKFHGPWIAGMTEGDFQGYLEKRVKNRKAEFLAWLRKDRLQQLKATARLNATHEGQPVGVADAGVEVAEQDFADYIKQLRSDASLGQPLILKIEEFLDLPPSPVLSSTNSMASASLTGNDPPPRTHPSAGLTYIQSDSYLVNHPVLGPQARRAPVEARVLVAEKTGFDRERGGKVGVAGVVAAAPPAGLAGNGRIRSITESVEGEESTDNDERSRAGQEKAGSTLGIHTTGGNRIWVEPTAALIDSRGRINLKVANPTQLTVEVHTGAFREPNYQRLPRTPRPMTRLDTPQPRSEGSQGEGSQEVRSQEEAEPDALLKALESHSWSLKAPRK